MFKVILLVVQNYLKTVQLSQIVIGTLVSVDPVEIKISDKVILTKENKLYILSESLLDKPGKKLLMLKNLGGQEFIILSEVKEVT